MDNQPTEDSKAQKMLASLRKHYEVIAAHAVPITIGDAVLELLDTGVPVNEQAIIDLLQKKADTASPSSSDSPLHGIAKLPFLCAIDRLKDRDKVL